MYTDLKWLEGRKQNHNEPKAAAPKKVQYPTSEEVVYFLFSSKNPVIEMFWNLVFDAKLEIYNTLVVYLP